MTAYFDTSAVVKKYVIENGTNQTVELWNKAVELCISKVGYAEVIASLYRKNREGELTSADLNDVLFDFKTDWSSFIHVDLNDTIFRVIDKLAANYALRGFDLIHLASAVHLSGSVQDRVTFVCADQRLLEAASGENLTVVDVSAGKENSVPV